MFASFGRLATKGLLSATVMQQQPQQMIVRNMATLKETKMRIRSVKSIQKITKSMKMVAAAKLRGVQATMEKSRPLYEATKNFFVVDDAKQEELNKQYKNILVVPIGGDRGLCGSANSSIIKKSKAYVDTEVAAGKEVSLVVVGDKPRVSLRRHLVNKYAATITQVGAKKTASFDECVAVARVIVDQKYDNAVLVFNQYVNTISFNTTFRHVPASEKFTSASGDSAANAFEFEGDQEEVMQNFYEYYLAVTVYNSVLETATSEMSQRMTAMDNATRNAGDVIQSLTIAYNRARQASITTELIEIISGANAIQG